MVINSWEELKDKLKLGNHIDHFIQDHSIELFKMADRNEAIEFLRSRNVDNMIISAIVNTTHPAGNLTK